MFPSWACPGAGYEWPDSAARHLRGHRRQRLARGWRREGRAIAQVHPPGQVRHADWAQGQEKGSNDTQNLGGAANVTIDCAANELYVADGYVNHRVIVFDATTGAYKWHWGNGKRPYYAVLHPRGRTSPEPLQRRRAARERHRQHSPPTARPRRSFASSDVVRIANDGLVYVCDRTNDCIQVFRKDGTFVKEGFVAESGRSAADRSGTSGSQLTREQKYLLVPDGDQSSRSGCWSKYTLEVVSAFWWSWTMGRAVLRGSTSPGTQRETSSSPETYEGKRVQKFVYKGMAPASTSL